MAEIYLSLLVEIPSKPIFSTFIGRNCHQKDVIFQPLLVELLTFIGHNPQQRLYLFSTFIGQNFDLYWSILIKRLKLFPPSLVELSTNSWMNLSSARGRFSTLYWSKFWPSRELVENSTRKISTDGMVKFGQNLVKNWVENSTYKRRKMNPNVLVYV